MLSVVKSWTRQRSVRRLAGRARRIVPPIEAGSRPNLANGAVAATLLPFPHAQPNRAENSNAVDSLLGGGRNRPISGLVDAAGLRSVMGNHSNSF